MKKISNSRKSRETTPILSNFAEELLSSNMAMDNNLLDDLDRKILGMIVENARIPFLEVARSCGVSGAAIHQRVQRLTSIGVLKGTEFLVDPTLIGYETCAYIGLYLKEPMTFMDVVNALNEIPEVVECHFTTGNFDIFMKIYAKNNNHLLTIIHDKLQPLGLSRSETIISLKQVIKKQIPLVNNQIQ